MRFNKLFQPNTMTLIVDQERGRQGSAIAGQDPA
jgi:hypothetical protein